jgi:hypothetical protein
MHQTNQFWHVPKTSGIRKKFDALDFVFSDDERFQLAIIAAMFIGFWFECSELSLILSGGNCQNQTISKGGLLRCLLVKLALTYILDILGHCYE